MFQDITTLLLDPKAFRDTIDVFVERYKDKGITVVAVNVETMCPFSFHSTLIVSSAIGIFMCCAFLISRDCFREKSGVEARGFIFGPPIALAIGAKFVPLRKPKKLPGMCCSVCRAASDEQLSSGLNQNEIAKTFPSVC
jgi:adenine phosphoribosyltransferase